MFLNEYFDFIYKKENIYHLLKRVYNLSFFKMIYIFLSMKLNENGSKRSFIAYLILGDKYDFEKKNFNSYFNDMFNFSIYMYVQGKPVC